MDSDLKTAVAVIQERLDTFILNQGRMQATLDSAIHSIQKLEVINERALRAHERIDALNKKVNEHKKETDAQKEQIDRDIKWVREKILIAIGGIGIAAAVVSSFLNSIFKKYL